MVDVSINTSGAKAGSAQARGAFSMIEADAAKASANVQGHMNAIDAATNKSMKSLGMWGTAFKGAFIGAVAGIAFSTLVSGITGIASATFEAGKNAVVAAAQFQDTTNAMKVFTGSIGAAKAELADIDQVARNTVGLRMADAEAGAIQLRGLGFAAKTAQDLLVGLAKQRTLNPAIDDAAVAKVIRNITQLSEGSPRAGQDIREMIAQMPTLNRIINDTFGSQQRFQQLLKTDSKDAIRQFTEALANTEGAAGGLNNAFGKLEDAWISAGRAFGEPFLDPLTRGFESLTNFLYENEKTWRSWGQGVADAISGVLVAIRAIDSDGKDTAWGVKAADNVMSVANEGILQVLSGGTKQLYNLAQAKGRYDRLQKERADAQVAQAKFNTENNLGGNVTYMMGDSYVDLTDRMARQQKALTRDQEQERNDLLKSYRDQDLENLKQSFANKQRAADVAHRYSTADEYKYQKSIIAIKKQEINAEMALQKQFFDQKRANSDGSLKQMLEIGLEEKRVMSSLSANYRSEELAAEKLQADRLAQIAEERRRGLIEANELSQRASTQIAANTTFDIERQIQRTGKGYDQLIAITDAAYTDITETIRRNLELQLQDQSLNEIQVANLKRKAQLDIQDASDEHRQKLLQINDQQNQRELDQIQAFTGRVVDQYNRMADQMATIGTNLRSGRIDKSLVTNIGEMLFGGDIDAQLAVLNTKLNTLTAARTRITDAFLADQGNDELRKAEVTIVDQIRNQKQFIEDLNGATSEHVKSVYRLTKAYQEGSIGIQEFQKGQLAFFDSETANRLAAASAKITGLRQEYSKLGGDIDKQNETQAKIDAAIADKANLSFSRAQERAAFYRSTIDGLLADYEKLKSADPELMRMMRDGAQGGALESRNAALEGYRKQEIVLGDEKLLQLARETELLRGITELRGQELNAIFRIDRAQLEINQKLVYSKNQADASVAEFLAGQKGITEIVSDTKINLLTTAYSGLDAVAGRLTKSFGAFRDVVKDLIANLLKLALNSLFQRMGFAGFGGQSGSSGGFSIPGLGGRGNQGSGGFSLPGLGGFFGGGNGPGGTPNWNPMAGGSTGSVWGLGGLSSSGLNGSPVFGGSGGSIGGLLGAGATPEELLTGSGSSGGLGGIGGLSGMATMLPFLGATLGASLFNGSRGSSIIGGVGGALTGLAGAGLLAGATGSGAVGSALGTIGLGAIAAPLMVAALFAGPAFLIGAFFLSRNARRRKEEKIRNQAMLDAFAAIDKLIADVNADRIDGASALAQADSVRANYMTEMSKLKDKKTRNKALADVSRIDAKIALLKSAVGNQVARRDRLELMVPTFAAGGNVNPVGYQTGSNQMGYFPSAGTWASYNERGNEYIFDAETTRNIGVSTLDSIRSNKGRSFGEMRQKMPARNYAVGGNVTNPLPLAGITGGAASPSGPIKLEISLNVGLAESDFVQVVEATVKNNDGSTEQLEAIVAGLKKAGQHQLASVLNKQIKAINGQ